MQRPKLEKRECACGCGQTWWALPASKNIFASEFHASAKGKKWGAERDPNRPKRGMVGALEVSQETGLGLSTVYQWAKARKIPAQRDGKGWLFDLATVKKALKNVPEYQ